MVFSLAPDLGGNGVTCPGCEHLLTIPSSADKVSELGVSRAKYSKPKVKEQSRDIVKHHRPLSQGEHHEWADEQSDYGDKAMKIMIPIALFSLLLIGGLAYLLLSDSNEAPRAVADVDSVVVEDTDIGEKAEGGEEEEEVYIYNSKNDEQVDQLEEFLTGLFAAKTVDEMLPYVRPTDNIREKLVKFYKGETLNQSPFKSLGQAMNTPEFPGFLTVSCQTQDYSNHVGVLKYTKDEIKLDWESFVAYSEMTWAELAEKKPTEKVRVRVTAKRAYYYNNEFTDESKWQAVSLISPNEQNPIYGYLEKNSATEQRLFNFELSDNRKVILDVYFPQDAMKGDQVFIDNVVEQGWVISEEK